MGTWAEEIPIPIETEISSTPTPEPSESSTPEVVEIEEEETPLGIELAVDVSVGLKGQGAIYYGDRVTLVAHVSNAAGPYTLSWQVNKGSGWESLGEDGSEYTFTIWPENEHFEYRVILSC